MAELNNNRSVTVGTTPVVVADDLFETPRIQIVIANVSDAQQKVYLAIDEEAEVGKGIYLDVGGSYTESEDAGFKPTKKRITAIATAAGAKLAISERVRV